MPGFKAPALSRVGRSELAVVVAFGGVTAGVTLALTVGAAHTPPKPAAPDHLLDIVDAGGKLRATCASPLPVADVVSAVTAVAHS